MANTPSVKTYDQILGEALATYQSKIGVTDLNPGSAVVSFFESNAQMVYRVTGDVFQILRDYSIDRATGDSLKRLAQEEGVTLKPAKAATSYVTIKDTSFEKIATKIYAGAKAPNAGTTVIYVGDVTGFPTSGQIYIGRGTPNVEGPLSYSSITSVGSYFQINLSSPTVKFHNISESVILAQGGVRTISPNIIVQTSSVGGTTPIKYSVTEQVIMLDGENEVFRVPIVAQTPSVDGNVARNAIKEFVVAPFTNATVSNPYPITNGRNDEDDESLRTRIKQARASKGLGTATAILSAVSGATSSSESASVVSAEIVTTGGQSTLYIDDGTGYERKTSGIGVEYIVDSALGGEYSFQLSTGGTQAGVAKASITSGNSQPYAISPNYRLSVLVGGTLSEHVFNTGDFKSDGAATAYEVVSSINADYNLLFRATTAAGGTKVVLEAKEETDEFLQITVPTSGIDSAPYFNFPAEEVETLKLFKNDSPLSANGRTAYINSVSQTYWSDTIASGETLILSVDGTPEQTYTIVDQDFADNTDFSIVSYENSLDSWCKVLNAKIPGITATIDGLSFRITSNRQKSSLASLSINPLSSFISKNIFSSSQTLTAQGSTKDYTFSRNTAQIKLTSPLSEKDTLTAGSSDAFARLKSGEILGATVSIASPGGSFWLFMDDPTIEMVGTTLTGNQQITAAQDPLGLSLTILNTAFSKVQVGDYAIVWSDELSAANRKEGRVISASSSQVVIALTPTETAAVVNEVVSYKDGIVFVRSESAPQRVSIAAGVYNINELADIMNSQINNAYFEVEKDSVFVLRANTVNPSMGTILIPTVTTNIVPMNLPIGVIDSAKISQVATYETPNDIDYTPAFAHSELSDAYANPPDSYLTNLLTNIDFSANEIDPNEIISFINGYAGDMSQPLNEITQIHSYAGTSVTIEPSEFIKRVKASDRAYVAFGYQFGAKDSLIVVLDNNPVEKTFIVPLYREITTNSTIPNNASTFNAYDTEYGPTGSLVDSFGSSFSFDNFKVLMRAKVVLDQYGVENAILYRAAVWGKSGEHYKISYEYPTSPNSDISHNVSVDKDTTIQLFLKSGNSISTGQDGVTEWDVTITPNTPVYNIDQVTYTWNGVGADPALTLSGGEYVKILDTGTFDPANIGVFRVSTATGFLPTAQSFTVQRPTGVAVTQTAAANIVPTTISFYQYSNTITNDMISYVNANLSNYVTAEVVNDSGMGGTGRITVSTYEASSFNYSSAYLRDGINWIESSNISGSPQFTLKNSLTYSADSGYTFNNAEKIRLVPTTPQQVSNMMNVLSVTGLSTFAKINTSNKGKRLQIATNTLGSQGALQVVGGSGNNITIDVIDTSVTTSDIYGKTFIPASQASTICSGQLLKVESSNIQEKNTNIEALNTIQIIEDSPIAGQSEIIIGNRQIGQRLFNIPRTHAVLDGNTWKIEKQGGFTCLSWTGVGNNPLLSLYPANFNVQALDTVNYVKAIDSDYLDIVSLGSTTFEDVEIGEFITISGHGDYDGYFEIQGKSDDQKTLRIINANAVSSALPLSVVSSTFTCNKTIDEGDTVVIDSPFDALNHGKFRVTRVYENSVYYETLNFKEEVVSLSAATLSLGDGTTGFTITKSEYTEISWSGAGTQPNFSLLKTGDKLRLSAGFNPNNAGDFAVVGVFSNKVQIVNPISLNETVVAAIDYFTPAINFFDYDSAIAGDNFVIRGSFFGTRAGSYSVLSVPNKYTVVVDGAITNMGPILLGANSDNAFLEEKTPYSGYKKVRMVTFEPTNPNLGIIVWTNKKQIDKINSLSGAVISAASRLGFPNTNKQGIDAYRYDTGLLAEANRIVYGDPRDRSTYPGVAAAGVDIFINPPLVKRISVGIVVRLNTGIPLIQVVEQIRNSVSALIDGNPIGKSIAISKIVSVVDSIPGVRALAITSPQYDQNNDLIVVQPNEKSFVIDSVTDISVSQLG